MACEFSPYTCFAWALNCSGSFLDDLERVTALKYMPTDDDVLKARLKTVGSVGVQV